MLDIELPLTVAPVVRYLEEENGMYSYFVGIEDKGTKCVIDYDFYTVVAKPDVGRLRRWLTDYFIDLVDSGAV